ncbi:hypothetical protein GCM10017786_35810 [Amycolatopsis deserti]|uniref:Uncharacterized protein n=1 Tax=Amycolatopsis deserti TaxID=185696 RepID=A0ABQ3IZM1_9PSEU|nr:hypothetical protein GCM10017786_35810 [Amycolatopsis deserti]
MRIRAHRRMLGGNGGSVTGPGTHYPGAVHRAVRRERVRWFNDEKFLAVDYRIQLWTHSRDAVNPVRL